MSQRWVLWLEGNSDTLPAAEPVSYINENAYWEEIGDKSFTLEMKFWLNVEKYGNK